MGDCKHEKFDEYNGEEGNYVCSECKTQWYNIIQRHQQQLTKQGDYLKLVEADRDAFREQLAEAKAEKEKLKADYKCLEWEYQGR